MFWLKKSEGGFGSTVDGILRSLAITTPDGTNKDSLTVTQADSTNNKSAIVISVAGTGEGLHITKTDSGNASKVVANVNDASDVTGLVLDVTNAGSGKAYSLITALGGLVGFGDSTPTVRLSVMGSGGQLSLAHDSNIGATFTVDAAKAMTIRTPNQGQIKLRPVGTEQTDSFQFINGAGNPILSADTLNDRIGIGLGADPPGVTLDIDPGADAQPLRADRAGTTTTDSIAEFVSNVGGADTTVCKVLVDGDLENVNNSYGAISDRRLKENITPAKPKLEKFMKLKFYSFNFKNNPKLKQFGLMADEVGKTFPGLVKTDPKTSAKSVKYSIINLILAKAFQEHMEKFHIKKPGKNIGISAVVLIFLAIISVALFRAEADEVVQWLLNLKGWISGIFN